MARSSALAEMPRRKITADEYQRMITAGILREGERVELIDGELIQMAAFGSPHVSCVMRCTNWFTPRVQGRAIVSIQNSFRLSPFSEPEPDVVLVRYRDDFYASALPGADDVLLIIEVADSSLRYDRDEKIPRYAAAGIPEAWLIDILHRRVSVYRDPSPEGYRQVVTHTRGAVLSPLAFPDLEMRWEDIFGRA